MQTFKIALIGDSMFDAWGADCPEMHQELKRLYSHSEFNIENHGLSGSRAGNALWRIGNDYPRNGQLCRCLSMFNPDVTIVESFAYSNSSDGPEGLSEYRDILRRLVEEIQVTTGSQVLFCLGIPPHRDKFLETMPNFFNTSRATRQRMADDVKLYLDEARRIALDEGWAYADVCMDIEKRALAGEHMRRFINQSDCLHPSRYGYQIMANHITRAIDNHRMIEEKIGH
ncbi:MAG: hypothetical protein JWN98_246 [Abditibacteriota bacterium]|nr:hypothetical protein [Abditibacteriota bacterium]